MSALRVLADQLGISISTASRALNGYDDVSAKTRERVLAAAEASGYQPHPLARRLATGRTGAVAMVSSMRSGHYLDPTFVSLLSGIDDVLAARGLYTLASAIPADESREVAALERLLDGRLVDAVILVRTRGDDARVDKLIERGIPFITYGRTARCHEHAWLDTDNEEAMRLLVERLASLGHERIDFIDGPAAFAFARLREHGWRRGLKAFGLQGRLRHGALTSAAGEEAAAALLAERADATALMCATDTIAIGAMAACRRVGRRVGAPGGVAVTGYGSTEVGRYTDPPLTTIDYGIEDNGRHLAQMLLELLDGAQATALTRIEPVRLVARQSDIHCHPQGDKTP
jgi:LacI family transcriptional regulator